MTTLPRHSDSVDKIVTTYFACVTAQPFEYKGKKYEPKPLRVSGGIFRGFECPPNCGGCCKKFTLDYLPSERMPSHGSMEVRKVPFNGHDVEIWTDFQNSNTTQFCEHLRKEDGRCGVHGVHPFSCDFELLRFVTFENAANQLSTRLFGRGWSYGRVDGGKGALCSITPVIRSNAGEVARKLKRLKEWTDHFGLVTVLPDMIRWAETGPHPDPLWLNQSVKGEAKFTLPIFQ